MKKLIYLFAFSFFASAQAQQGAVTVPALQSSAPAAVTGTNTQQPAVQPAKPQEQVCNAVCKAASAPITPARKPVQRVKNDNVNGFKYPPARVAAEKSTEWANLATAMVTRGDGGRVMVIFGQSVPKIGCAYLRVCSVELEPGETVNKVDAGDPVRWSITPAIVGEGLNRTVHVVIKPKSDEPGLYTNVKIATNRRMYDLDIFSVTGERFVRRIAFSYPENEQREWEKQQAAMEKEDSLVTAQLPTLSVDKLNFGYEIEGDYPHKPVRVFDDKEKTYIQMSLEFRSQEAPVLMLIGSDGKEQLVNYRLKNGYYIVDKIFSKAALLVGVGGNQQKVVITRAPVCIKRTFFGGCVTE